ncbi:MAG: CARDB domain-containing protein [Verrucomicrobiota bacterium JB022]|nr:CARDB domain-containing protein [Verrucomicrobiota bacterium JB022]
MNLHLPKLQHRSLVGMLGCSLAAPLLPVVQADTLEAGDNYVMVITESGELWTWGTSATGGLGLDTATTAINPTRVLGDREWLDVAIGADHTVAIAADGSLWAWGSNASGQLGTGGTDDRRVPQRIGYDNDWKDVDATGSYTLALKSNGVLYGWGSNNNAQLLRSPSTFPRQLSPLILNDSRNSLSGVKITAMSAGVNHVLAVDSEGRLLGWGLNASGQLGIPGLPALPSQSVQVISTDPKWVSVEAGAVQSFALDNQGQVYAFGYGTLGSLGLGGTSTASTPTRVPFPAGVQIKSIKMDRATPTHVVAISTEGDVYAWGANTPAFGQLGVDLYDDYDRVISANMQFSSPQKLVDKAVFVENVAQLDFTEVAMGDEFTLLRAGASQLYATGSNAANQLGTGLGAGGSNVFLRVPLGIPDMVAEASLSANETPYISGTFDLSLTLSNIGSGPLPSNSGLEIALYLSEDPNFSRDTDVRLPVALGADRPMQELGNEIVYNNSLAGSNQRVLTASVGLPADRLRAGTYYLFVDVNGEGTTLEANLDNNTFQVEEPLSFTPDLSVVATLTVPDAPVNVGETIALNYTLANGGTAQVVEGTTLQAFYQYLGTATGTSTTADKVAVGPIQAVEGPILPNSSTTGTLNLVLPSISAGNYRFGIFVDPANQVEEISEVNNESTDNRPGRYVQVLLSNDGSNNLKEGADFTVQPAPTSEDGQLRYLNPNTIRFNPAAGAQWQNTTALDAIQNEPNNEVQPYTPEGDNALIPQPGLVAGQSASFEIEVTGPFVVEFVWGLAATEAGIDNFNDSITFTIDGAAPFGFEDQAVISGNQGWTAYRQLVEKGATPRKLRWTYTRGTGSPAAYAFVDRIVVREELRPDLTVESVEYNSQNIELFILKSHQYLDVVINGINAGAAMEPAGGSHFFDTEVRLSRDKVWGNSDDVILGVLEELQDLDGNGRFIYGQDFDMNFCMPDGEYYLAVYVDSTRRYREINDETADEILRNTAGWPLYAYTDEETGQITNLNTEQRNGAWGIVNPFDGNTFVQIANRYTGTLASSINGVRLRYAPETNNNIWFSDEPDIVIEGRPYLEVNDLVYRPGIYYRESEWAFTFNLENSGCKDFLPGSEATLEISLAGYDTARESVEGSSTIPATTFTGNGSLDRVVATVRDVRGLPRGTSAPFRSSLRIPKYNEAAVSSYAGIEPNPDETYIPPVFPAFSVSRPEEEGEPISYLPLSTIGITDTIPGDQAPWRLDGNQNFVDPNVLRWPMFFFPSNALVGGSPYSLFFTREPAAFAPRFTITANVPLAVDELQLTFTAGIFVDVTPPRQTLRQWQTFWNIQREMPDFLRQESAAFANNDEGLGLLDNFTVPLSSGIGLDYVGQGASSIAEILALDPDGDGYTNAAEWAFVANPLKADLPGALVATDLVVEDQNGTSAEYLQVTFNALSDYSNSSFIYEVWASDSARFNGFEEDAATNTVRLLHYDPRAGGNADNAEHLRTLRPAVQAVIHNGYSYRITVRDVEALGKDASGNLTQARFIKVMAYYIPDSEFADKTPFNEGASE